MVEIAVTAERVGFDSVWLGEHVIAPRLFESQYPYHESTPDEPAFHARLPFYDPYGALSYLAARTEALLLAVSVSIVPLHDPYHLARQVATIDLFSGGRFLLGVGAGWLKEEFEIVGQEWKERGSRMEEALELMVRLWNDDEPCFDGRFYTLPPAGMEPKPITRPHPPFVFGGMSPIALRRAARLGDGWLGVGLSVEEIVGLAETLQRLRVEAGRGADPFCLTVAMSPPPDPEQVATLAAAGIDRIVVRPWRQGREASHGIEAFADRMGLVAAVRGGP
jgi:probable F420-dependent oxidoreductase